MKDPLIKSWEMLVLLILPDRAQPAGTQSPAPWRRPCSVTQLRVLSWMPREEVRAGSCHAEVPWVEQYLSFPSCTMNAVLGFRPLCDYPHACTSVSPSIKWGTTCSACNSKSVGGRVENWGLP